MDKKEIFVKSIKENESILYKIASVYTDNIEDRKDLIQEMIYNLRKSFDSFNERCRLSTWMYRVALNVAIYQLKITKRKLLTLSIDETVTVAEQHESHDFEEKLEIFRNKLDNLNLLDKGIVMLYLEGKSYQEIAEITGITESNVGTKLSRIKEKLKKQITK